MTQIFATDRDGTKYELEGRDRLSLMDILGKLGPISMGRLSGETFISPANTTHTVRKLEAAGLVKRLRSESSEP